MMAMLKENHGPFDGTDGDAWVASVDNAGLIWQQCIGGSSKDDAHCIIRTSDGGYAVTGHAESLDGDFSDKPDGHFGFVVKLDNGGNIIWKQ